MEVYEKLQSAIEKADKICVFTGAGISCPSGIPDFRSSNGLYNQNGIDSYSPEQIISHTFFTHHTKLFYKFYKEKMIYENAKPNLAHKYFAKLESKGKKVTVVTQNIDGLHQMAGSSNVFELHGSVHRNYCTSCGEFYNLDYILNSDLPKCKKCGAIVKPDVVLYEESLDAETINKSINAICECDMMIVVGTSLTVYPAASFVNYFTGDCLALINKDETNIDTKADIVINDDIIKVIKILSKN